MSRKLTTFQQGANVHTADAARRVAELEQEAAAPALVGSPPPAARPKINRERLNVLVPADVFEWFREQAYGHRLNMTDYVTHLMLDYMEASGVDPSETAPLRPKKQIPQPEDNQ